MRVPFPFNINVGTDIIAYRRMLKPQPRATNAHLQRLALRFLHPIEVSDLNRRFPDWSNLENNTPPAPKDKIVVHLAGRWAAKEAAKKAWGAHLVGFKDLRVETLPDGEVQIVCQPYRDAKSSVGRQRDDAVTLEQAAKLSISHDGEYAIATVIASPLHQVILKDLQVRKAEAISRTTNWKDQESV